MSLTATGRRPTGLLLALIAVAIVIGTALSALVGDDSPSGQLRRSVDEAVTPAQFGYTYRRGGTRVLDCMLANTGYAGDVDRDAETLVVRLTADAEPPINRSPSPIESTYSRSGDRIWAGPWSTGSKRRVTTA